MRRIKGLNFWAQTFLYSVAFITVLVLVYFIAEPFHQIYDLSAGRRFSLSLKTQEILKQFQNDPVKLVGFFKSEDPAVQEIESFLPSFKRFLPRLNFERYDLERDPEAAKRYGVHESGILLVEGKGRRAFVMRLNEEGIRATLEKILNPKRPVIFFSKGHGEIQLQDTVPLGFSFLKDRLFNEAYTVRENVLESPTFVGTDVLVVAYPKRDFQPAELEKLRAYLEKGNAIFMVDPEEPRVYPNLFEFLARYGIGFGNNVILDRSSRLFGADDLIPVVATFTQHEIVQHLENPLFFPLSRSVKMVDSPEARTWEKDYLVFSSSESWGETDYNSLEQGSYTFTEGEDEKGPLPLAMALERKGEPKNRLLAFGDSDFINNTNFNVGANRFLFLNALSWVLKEEIRYGTSKTSEVSRPWVLPAKGKTYLFLGVIAFPVLISLMVFGGIFFLRRLLT